MLGEYSNLTLDLSWEIFEREIAPAGVLEPEVGRPRRGLSRPLCNWVGRFGLFRSVQDDDPAILFAIRCPEA
jgi:hypothetical protein